MEFAGTRHGGAKQILRSEIRRNHGEGDEHPARGAGSVAVRAARGVRDCGSSGHAAEIGKQEGIGCAAYPLSQGVVEGRPRSACPWETCGLTDLIRPERRSHAKLSLDKKKIGILLLEGIHPSALEAFRADGYTNITQHAKSLPEAQLLEAVREASVIDH